MARNLKSEMENLGYKEIETDTIEKQGKSIIIYNNKKVVEQLKVDIEMNNIKKNKNRYYNDYDAVIIIGEDVKIE